jgi:HD superfamily phosphodiesterase
MKILSQIFDFVIYTTAKYNIDDSHGISHSLDVLKYSNSIYELEVIKRPHLKEQEKLIYISSALHDMCDKKYMNEKEGLENIQEFLKYKLKPDEINITSNIINTMSYSKVKKNGFPSLDNYQWAYHIVREADLLSAYKFERALMYHMCVNKESIDNALINAKDIFNNRVLLHNNDNLFFTEYGQIESLNLHDQAIIDMYQWNKIINKKI